MERNYEEPSLINSDEFPLRSIETNNSVEDYELQVTNVDVISNKEKKSLNRIKSKERIEIEPSLIRQFASKNSIQQREQALNASFLSLLIKNTSSYKQQSFSS
ncbi:21788_t:CDS:2 [Cetraspora pellucida]|uniref:21788_t:CDS:1 n=1 Tax=Cetraspora pellucida TaxID=1433469 RepID=A0A9N9BYW4_9GLOM|nr:21788_t:CDS:2 [Cetraspora pellucida]